MDNQPMPQYDADPDSIQKAIVMGILQQYAGKNFVNRIVNRDNYPILDRGNGDYSTHKMAWSTGDKGNAMVYPTIVYDKKNDQLNELEPRQAQEHAIKNKEFIPFKTPQEADWFSQNYKRAWNAPEQPILGPGLIDIINQFR